MSKFDRAEIIEIIDDARIEYLASNRGHFSTEWFKIRLRRCGLSAGEIDQELEAIRGSRCS